MNMSKKEYIEKIERDCTCEEVFCDCCRAEADLSGSEFPEVIKAAAEKQKKLQAKFILQNS